MQAHVAPSGGRLIALEPSARVVAHDERAAVCAQQGMDLGREPALVAELERMAPGRQLFQGSSKEPIVAAKVLGQLPQHGAEAARSRERLDALAEAGDALARLRRRLTWVR